MFWSGPTIKTSKCVTKRRFGDIHGPKPYKFIRFGDIHGANPHKFIGFGDIYGAKPYKFIGLGGDSFEIGSNLTAIRRISIELVSNRVEYQRKPTRAA